MTRRLITCAVLATAIALAGPISRATAQYAVRGGPIYGGPVYGGGPSLFVGSYSQPYFAPQLTGAGYGSTYIGSYPQYNGYAAAAPMVMGSTGYYYPMVVQQPQPQINPSPPPPPLPPPPGSNQTAPGAPAEGSRSAPGTTTTPGAGPTPVQPATGRAYFTVKLPADAKLLVTDVETKQTGTSRRFHTPQNLDPVRAYEYTFRAQWIEGGQPVTRDKTVRFKTGDDMPVDFTQAAAR